MPSWNKDHKISHRQPWEGEADKFSTEEEWLFQYSKDKFLFQPDKKTEEKKQMSLAPWQMEPFEDNHHLEHDKNIKKSTYDYSQFGGLTDKYILFVAGHPIAAPQIAGSEVTRDLLGKLGYSVPRGKDTSGDAIRFATAGLDGIDRVGIALQVFQPFNQKYKWIKQPDGNYKKKTIKTGNGTEVNAARHTLWNMINTNRFGIRTAKAAADVHETNQNADTSKRIFDPDDYKESSTNPKPKKCVEETPEDCALADADEVVDLLNNQIGRNLALRYRKGTSTNDLAIGMIDEFYLHGLYTIKQSGGKYEVVKTRITRMQYFNMRRLYESGLDEHGFPKEIQLE